MKVGISRVILFVALVAVVGGWIAAPSSARAHPDTIAVTLHADLVVDAGSVVDATDCGVGSTERGACCAASGFGCCAPCVLLAPESAAAKRTEEPIFIPASAETAAGLPRERFKRPPRFAE
jgi:hypothetical protein